MSVWISRGVNVEYCGRVRREGGKKWTPVCHWTRSRRKAYRAMMRAFEDPHWKRGEVLMIADYYDPVAVVEIKR